MARGTGTWKDHHVEYLRGDPTSTPDVYAQPTRAMYLHWLDAFRKALGAMLLLWIIPMALDLEIEQGKFLPLVHGEDADDFRDSVFEYIVVAKAIAAGAINALPKRRELLVNAEHCSKNYSYIMNNIAAFSAQLSTCCC
eukprot:514887-Rhodomonas_salina.1